MSLPSSACAEVTPARIPITRLRDRFSIAVPRLVVTQMGEQSVRQAAEKQLAKQFALPVCSGLREQPLEMGAYGICAQLQSIGRFADGRSRQKRGGDTSFCGAQAEAPRQQGSRRFDVLLRIADEQHRRRALANQRVAV